MRLVQGVRDYTEIPDADKMWNYSIVKASHIEARALLTSTDPAVLDSMQDALVRAGRLREEKRQMPARHADIRYRYQRERRLVTDWTEADQ